jgi:hypothetical protein
VAVDADLDDMRGSSFAVGATEDQNASGEPEPIGSRPEASLIKAADDFIILIAGVWSLPTLRKGTLQCT